MYNPKKDDIYAYALSKTLTKVSSPATVGLYSSCQNRLSIILGQMQGILTPYWDLHSCHPPVYMDKESARIEAEHKGKPGWIKPRSVKPSFIDFIALLGRLLFYRPTWTKKIEQNQNIRFVYVHFSAWHFAGSDLLWAGIAIRLFQAMQLIFGKLQLALYRVAQYDEEEEVETKKDVDKGSNLWRSKKICCFPLWLFVLCILLVPVIILIIILSFGLPDPELKPEEGVTKKGVGVLEGLLIASLGVPAATALRFTFEMAKNLLTSQDRNIKKGLDNEQVSSKLGFMNEVRKEMWFLSSFIHFMEIFERRKIRVVLNITNLDRCTPKKIVGVLEAIDILLSDDESPFISILAVNPHVLVQKVNFADGCFSQEDRAYALLNRIVTLAFTVPPLSDDSKQSLFCNLSSNPGHNEDMCSRNITSKTMDHKESLSPDTTQVIVELEECSALMFNSGSTVDVSDEEVETMVRMILTSSDRKLNKYMSDDSTSMRRVINSVRVTVIIMMAVKMQHPQLEFIAAWVVLANQWPCRLSWIIQCAEDAQQRAEIDGKNGTKADCSKTLWEVFSKSRAELYVMKEQIEDLLEQDGDPELFERFLAVDFQFTVKDLKIFEVLTVNLDHSIKKELAQIRGTSKLKDSGWMRNLAPLPITTLIKMETEDVCKELEKMEFSTKYIDKVKSNDLNGMALVFGNTDDLKKLLNMTFGEWATFRLHFLTSFPNLRPQYRNMAPSNQHFKFKDHVGQHHLSNPSLFHSST